MPWKSPTHSQRQSRQARDREYDERRRRDPALAEAQRLRRSQRWKKVRALKLAQDPLCEDCKAHGVTRAATQVHHVVGLVERPDLAFDLDGTVSLCTTCHALREGTVRRG